MKQLKSTILHSNDFLKITLIFIVWRLSLFLISYLATLFIPNFGNTYPYVDRVLSITNLPSWIWGFGGFDGVHYLRLAQDGYIHGLSQAFFQLFPVLINFVSKFIPVKNILDTEFFVNTNFFYAGLITSNIFALVSIYTTKKLFDLDYNQKVSWMATIFLLLFPTSFYLGSIYTESLFITLASLTLFFYKRNNYILAAVCGFLVSATRLIGIFIPLILIIDCFKNKNLKLFFSGITGSLGLVIYMVYSYFKFDDFLSFLTAQSSFGAERSSVPIILLPQVVYRYIKILFTTPITSLTFYNSLFEILITVFIFTFLILAFKKINMSYWIAILGILILPTLTGTFSSMPRYALGAYLLFPLIVTRLKNAYTPVIIIFLILGIICISLFTRGYWVA